jgi:hypothetical protein
VFVQKPSPPPGVPAAMTVLTNQLARFVFAQETRKISGVIEMVLLP